MEPNPHLRSAGAVISAAAHPLGPPIEWREDLPEALVSEASGVVSRREGGEANTAEFGAFDLVVVAYSLSSLTPAGLPRVLDALWSRTADGGVLALVDSAGESSTIAMCKARRHLDEYAAGARLLAPFPRAALGATSVFGSGGAAAAEPWPLPAFDKSFRKGSTLELTQQVLESEAARELGRRTEPSRKGTERLVRFETFVYLLYTKEAGALDSTSHSGSAATEARIEPNRVTASNVAAAAAGSARDAMWGAMPYGRVLGLPRKRTRHVLVDVVLPSGSMGTYVISRRGAGRADYRFARKLKEGSTVPLAILERSVGGAGRSWAEPGDEEERVGGRRGGGGLLLREEAAEHDAECSTPSETR